jgi:hypothetical protein
MFLEMGKIWTDHGEFGVEIFWGEIWVNYGKSAGVGLCFVFVGVREELNGQEWLMVCGQSCAEYMWIHVNML